MEPLSPPQKSYGVLVPPTPAGPVEQVLMRRAQPHCYLRCSPLTRACQCSQMAHHSIGPSGNVSRSCGHTIGMLSVTGVCGLLHFLTSEHPLSPCLAQFQSVPTCSARLGPSAIRQPLLMSALHGCLALGEHMMSPGVLGVTPPLTLFCDNMIWPVSYSLFHGHLGFYFGVITPPIHRVTQAHWCHRCPEQG